MKNKARVSLKDLELNGDLNDSSVYSLAKQAPNRLKVHPKKKASTNTIKRSNETSEVHRELEEDLIDVERGFFSHTWGRFQKCVVKIVNHKYFRWGHLCLELIYFTLVLFYLYFLMEIEKNNSIILIAFMMSFLVICLIVYVMNIIDHWNDFRTIIDTVLIGTSNLNKFI
jgi:hypothetical protein